MYYYAPNTQYFNNLYDIGPQIVELVTGDNSKKNEEELCQVLKTCFTALMCQESDIVTRELEKLNTRLQNGHSSGMYCTLLTLTHCYYRTIGQYWFTF